MVIPILSPSFTVKEWMWSFPSIPSTPLSMKLGLPGLCVGVPCLCVRVRGVFRLLSGLSLVYGVVYPLFVSALYGARCNAL